MFTSTSAPSHADSMITDDGSLDVRFPHLPSGERDKRKQLGRWHRQPPPRQRAAHHSAAPPTLFQIQDCNFYPPAFHLQKTVWLDSLKLLRGRSDASLQLRSWSVSDCSQWHTQLPSCFPWLKQLSCFWAISSFSSSASSFSSSASFCSPTPVHPLSLLI